VRLAIRVFIKQKQFSERVDRKVTFCVFLFIDYCRRKGLLGRLALKYLFFYRACGYETIYEAYPEVMEQTAMSTGTR
jgi:hypothetical protein